MTNVILVSLDFVAVLLGVFLLYQLWKHGRNTKAAIVFMIIFLIVFGAGYALWNVATGATPKYWATKVSWLLVEFLIVIALFFRPWYNRSTQFNVL